MVDLSGCPTSAVGRVKNVRRFRGVIARVSSFESSTGLHRGRGKAGCVIASSRTAVLGWPQGRCCRMNVPKNACATVNEFLQDVQTLSPLANGGFSLQPGSAPTGHTSGQTPYVLDT